MRTTVPVTTPLRPPRAGKGKPAEEKTAPPASSSRSDKRYVRSYGRSARRDQRAVCSPSLPARLPASSSPASASYTDWFPYESISKTNPVKPEARLFPRVREGGLSFFPPLFSLFLVFFISSWFFFFFLFLFFSFLSQRHTRGRTLRSPEKPDAQGVKQRCGSSPWPREKPPCPLTSGAIQL